MKQTHSTKLGLFRFQSLNGRTQIWAWSTSLGLSTNSKPWGLTSQFDVQYSWRSLTKRKTSPPFTKLTRTSVGFTAPPYFRILCTWWAASETWELQWSFSLWPRTKLRLPQQNFLWSTQMGVGTPKSSKQNNLMDQIFHSPQWEDRKWKGVRNRCLIPQLLVWIFLKPQAPQSLEGLDWCPNF